MKVIKFYCDILNTYASSIFDDRNQDIILFCNHLKELVKLEQADIMEFYFSQEENDNLIIAKYQQELYKNLDHNLIVFSKQFFLSDDMKFDKLSLIVNDLKSYIKHNINDEIVLYYAGALTDNHYKLAEYLNRKFPSIEHNHFVLGNISLYDSFNISTSRNKNLNSLNEAIGKFINKKKENNNEKKC